MNPPLISSPLGVAHTLTGDERTANPTTVRVQRERPILFSGPMVRAILNGEKNQTRRVIAPRNSTVLGYPGASLWGHLHFEHGEGPSIDRGSTIFGCGPNCDYLHVPAWHPEEQDDVVSYRVRPVAEPGERLWVKETFSAHGALGADGRKVYRADIKDGKEPHGLHWKPSIFMPRSACRIVLDIIEVRAQRLQDITDADARTEGVTIGKIWAPPTYPPRRTSDCYKIDETPRQAFARLWDSINGKGAWAANPWVWAITFRRTMT